MIGTIQETRPAQRVIPVKVRRVEDSHETAQQPRTRVRVLQFKRLNSSTILIACALGVIIDVEA